MDQGNVWCQVKGLERNRREARVEHPIIKSEQILLWEM